VRANVDTETLRRLYRVYASVRWLPELRLPAGIASLHGEPVLYLRPRRSKADLERSLRWALAPKQRAHAAACRRGQANADWNEAVAS
jgi:hypothetical protein